MLLQKIISPIVLAIIFYALITPIGILMLIFQQRPINMQWPKPRIRTFWQQKIKDKNTELDTFKNQF
jgi:archaellum biogenesis protein FlaJ (TadC family)